MARLEGIKDEAASWLQRLVFRGARLQGEVPEPIRLMAHSGSVMWAAGFYELTSARGTRVSTGLKGLASLKAASLIGCVF